MESKRMEMEEVYMESPKTSLKIKIKTIRGAEKGVVSSNTGKKSVYLKSDNALLPTNSYNGWQNGQK